MFDFLYELNDKPMAERVILVDKWIGIIVCYKWFYYSGLF